MKLIKNILYVAQASIAQGPSMARAVSLAENYVGLPMNFGA